jgi:hypothetical protein
LVIFFIYKIDLKFLNVSEIFFAKGRLDLLQKKSQKQNFQVKQKDKKNDQ